MKGMAQTSHFKYIYEPDPPPDPPKPELEKLKLVISRHRKCFIFVLNTDSGKRQVAQPFDYPPDINGWQKLLDAILYDKNYKFTCLGLYGGLYHIEYDPNLKTVYFIYKKMKNGVSTEGLGRLTALKSERCVDAIRKLLRHAIQDAIQESREAREARSTEYELHEV